MAVHAVERLKNMNKRKTSALGVVALVLLLMLIFILRMNNIELQLPGDIEVIYRTFEKLEVALNDGCFEGLNSFFDDEDYSENLIESTEAPNTTTSTTEAPTTTSTTTKAPTTTNATTKAPVTTSTTTKAPVTTSTTTKAPVTTSTTTKAPVTTSTTTKAPVTTSTTTKAPVTTSTTTKAPVTTSTTTKAPTTKNRTTKAHPTPKKRPTTRRTTTTTTTTQRPTPPPRPQSRVGEPLILTPFLKSGYDAYARQRASVNLDEFPTVESYAGYFTVNVNYDSNLFFWFFPATGSSLICSSGKAHAIRTFQEVRPVDAPVVLFLEGMLGMSALCSIFFKNGPFEMGGDGRPQIRRNSLNMKHNVIYLDSPVTAGYSYINSDQVFPTPTQISDEVYEAMRQFFEMFPYFRRNEFFVVGESMAGQFVPLVTWRIHDRNQHLPADKRINLKGMAIGNGWVDPKNQLIWGESLHNLGLVDEKEREELRRMEKQAQDYINNGYHREATSVIEQLIWDRDSLIKSFTGYEKIYNFLEVDDNRLPFNFVQWITSEKVRFALHVGANHFQPKSRNVQSHLRYDMTRSVAYISSVLLSHYRVLIYTGELDMFCSYLSVQNWLGKLNWSGAMQFRNARKEKWLERGILVGYKRKHGNLIEVLVRNAGHFSSIDQPQRIRELLEHFTHGQEF